VKGAVSGVFCASGQTCMADSLLLMQKAIHDAVIEKLIAAAVAARIADPSKMDTQIGPIATRPQWEQILRIIGLAKQDGAVCALGGHALSGPDYRRGRFVAPIIFAGAQRHAYRPGGGVQPGRASAQRRAVRSSERLRHRAISAISTATSVSSAST
jgi:acyl-CoA reductase-like NAD-dependent aldehyde dehydrogenase